MQIFPLMLVSSERKIFSTNLSGFSFLFSQITFSLEEFSKFSVMSQFFLYLCLFWFCSVLVCEAGLGIFLARKPYCVK